MGASIFSHEQVLLFILVFLRISAMLVMLPIVGERSVPARVKGGLAVLMTLIVFSTIRTEVPVVSTEAEIPAMICAMTGEALIGIIIGFTARIIFAGIQFAGEMIGIQMGFSIANVIDPMTNAQVSVMAEFQYLIALLVFLAVDAHHIFLVAIVDSYRSIAPLGFHFPGSLMQAILTFSGSLFTIAVKISAPVMAALLFTNVALGIVARTVPQINVFIVGFPLQIAAGLIVFGLTAPVFVALVQRSIGSLMPEVHVLLRWMAG